MLGPAVTAITLVYAEKVKFIAFTFPAPHHARVRTALRLVVHRPVVHCWCCCTAQAGPRVPAPAPPGVPAGKGTTAVPADCAAGCGIVPVRREGAGGAPLCLRDVCLRPGT